MQLDCPQTTLISKWSRRFVAVCDKCCLTIGYGADSLHLSSSRKSFSGILFSWLSCKQNCLAFFFKLVYRSAWLMRSRHLISNTNYANDPSTFSANLHCLENTFWELMKCSETTQWLTWGTSIRFVWAQSFQWCNSQILLDLHMEFLSLIFNQ